MKRIAVTAAVTLAAIPVLAALLVHYGRTRAQAQGEVLGFDVRLLDVGAAEYALRSIGPVLWLVLATLAIGALCGYANRRVRGAVAGMDEARRQRLRFAPVAVCGVAVALPVLVYATSGLWAPASTVVLPVSIGLGIVTAMYALVLARLLRGAAPEPFGLALLTMVLALGACLFWTAENTAVAEGRALAAQFVQDREANALPKVTVFSESPLGLTGVREESALGNNTYIGDFGNLMRFKYSGLILLDRVDERYFLIPQGSRDTTRVIVITEAPGLRFEFETKARR